MNIIDQINFHPEALKILFEVLFTEGSFNILWTGAIIVLLMSFVYPIKNKWIFVVPAVTIFGAAISPFIFSSAYEYLLSRTTINRSLLQTVPLIIFVCCIIYEGFYKSKEGTTQPKRT